MSENYFPAECAGRTLCSWCGKEYSDDWESDVHSSIDLCSEDCFDKLYVYLVYMSMLDERLKRLEIETLSK